MPARFRYQRRVSLNITIIVLDMQYHIKYEKIWTHSAIVKHYVDAKLSFALFSR